MNRQPKLSVVLLVCLLAAGAPANPISDNYAVPKDAEVLRVLGTARPAAALNADRIRVLVWNIQKSKDKHWARDLRAMAGKSDLVLLQECLDSENTEPDYDRIGHLRWDFATAFIEKRENAAAGVATGSRARPSMIRFLRSPVEEPITHTPKMTLVTRYALAGVPKRSGRLLVVNVHGTNFRGPRAFSRQIKGVIEAVGKHNGPVLMAGDFNTWSEDRIDELRKLARRAGLAEVEFGEGRKQFMGNALDRMFVRDLRVLTRRVRSDVRSSDHRPLEAELAYEPAAAAD